MLLHKVPRHLEVLASMEQLDIKTISVVENVEAGVVFVALDRGTSLHGLKVKLKMLLIIFLDASGHHRDHQTLMKDITLNCDKIWCLAF